MEFGLVIFPLISFLCLSGRHRSFAFVCRAVIAWSASMVSEEKGFYSCPNCKSLYHVVRVEAGAETTEHICSGCREPLPPRDGRSILKYLYLPDVSERRRIDPRG